MRLPELAREEETILQRIARGDPTAVQDCIQKYGDLIWSLARRYLRWDADAEDAVQEIFIELWNSAARFDRKVGTEVAFVATIARRRLIDRVRQKGRRPAMDSLDSDEAGELPDLEPAVLPQMEEESDLAVVARVLATMAPEHREILSMSLYEGYSHSEIAERLDLPLGTVKTRVRRGLLYVRQQLGIDAAAGGEDE
jgi:RNA polymerase sigma-70 factor (ECF subfamily)